MKKRLAIVGGGWAGVAAALRGLEAGAEVHLFEMAGQLGGRARSLSVSQADEPRLDNGQHIMIGAYTHSLALMRSLGLKPEDLLLRRPLQLRYPDRAGLHLPPGAALPAFVRAVLALRHWRWRDRLALLAASSLWALRGFRCAPDISVAQLCAGLPPPVMQELIAPLCVAALNTPAEAASASVFLRVLHDALFSGPGSADLLLPRRPLSELLAEPAQRQLLAAGATLHLNHTVRQLDRKGQGWSVDGEHFDAVLLACSSRSAADLARAHAPAWAERCAALQFQPIITVYLRSPGSRLAAPMLALGEGPEAPAQFVFDLGQLGHAPELFAFVVSGAAPWVERGLPATAEACIAQASDQLHWASPPTLLRALAEKRATFACTPGLQRPASSIAERLAAAGDYIAGPYPATLEGAVRSGEEALALLRPVLTA
ncbi:hydroxysqualene dehydroxylase HpnE [Paucibacter sp. APW11]|uniref:Hydroxysqualene dehydroxylase HpnE n=1 Tax=Roseateles aquae TaxID=3077235 RepID=A0ABU3P7J2_9BURK|nr:hydroxysqualene dehydroxylase HpnE [Paucibacter sp. APW11]MDT8998551.1 hydroxysqualene dehydroxylase HpnE [Paucibacter sp. APW11]